MTNTTVTKVLLFDEHDIALIARRNLMRVLAQVETDDLNVLIRCGRKLLDKEPLPYRDTLQMAMVMMRLRLDGIIDIPLRLLNCTDGRQQVYQHLCMELFRAVSHEQ